VSGAKEDERTGRRTTTTMGEMGGHLGLGGGPPATDLLIRPMGGHAGQAGDGPGTGAVEDGGRRPRSASRGKEDERGG
jgi:hypothetical protein